MSKQVVGGFVVGEQSAQGNVPMQVEQVAPAELYLVKYTDKENKTQVRLVVKAKIGGEVGDLVFMFNERISGQRIATSTSSWFADQFLKKAGEQQVHAEEVDTI